MGSSSKKYKEKTDRKRRHRSRSISDDEATQKRHKHSRRHHHKERRRDRKPQDHESGESDVVEISDHEEVSPSPPPVKRQREKSPEDSTSNNQSHDSLSIEETNKLRAKLGLKPLQVDSEASSSKRDDAKKKDDWGEFYHKPAGNLAETAHTEKLKSRLSERKERRQIESKLSKVKTLGESDSEDDASAWVSKNRKLEDLKRQAEQRAKALEELDEQFGVSDFIQEETRAKRKTKYTEKNLTGLRVDHNTEAFKEGKTVILTLKDQAVLDEDDDVLVNVNMQDDERYEKSVLNKKKKPLYNPYDVEEVDEFGNMKQKNLLYKYDEEIEGEKREGFKIGEDDAQEYQRRVTESIKAKLANKRIEHLNSTNLTLASDYYNEEELAKFKKPKKKLRKMRKDKMLTADDLEVKPDTAIKEEEVQLEEKDEDTLEKALKKAKRLKKERDLITSTSNNFKELLSEISKVKEEPPEKLISPMDSGNIILNSTAEFCRTLGDIPTYGKSGNRAENEELMDFDKDIAEEENSDDDCQIVEPNNWNSVDPFANRNVQSEVPILDEEPDVGSGVGAALKLAMSKGYLDKEESNRPSNSRLAYLQAQHYSIEDKNHGEDGERGGARRERYAGPVTEFREKDLFKPNVKLEYIDDEGHVLNSKEAFRYLSHKFHGKGPGKNKIEKRLKKSLQEGLMKKMSSTDTPLGTLNMLQAKQKEIQSPYIVLSGGKTHSTSISKARR